MWYKGDWDQESSGSSQDEEKKRWNLSWLFTPGNPKLAWKHKPVIPGLKFMTNLSNTVKPYVKKMQKLKHKRESPKWGDQHSLGTIIYWPI